MNALVGNDIIVVADLKMFSLTLGYIDYCSYLCDKFKLKL